MARTIEELDHEISTLRTEVDLLKRANTSWPELVRQFAGCFTDDTDWAAIHEKIEEARRQPDPDLAEP